MSANVAPYTPQGGSVFIYISRNISIPVLLQGPGQPDNQIATLTFEEWKVMHDPRALPSPARVRGRGDRSCVHKHQDSKGALERPDEQERMEMKVAGKKGCSTKSRTVGSQTSKSYSNV